jgi:hypothetical protein
MMIMDNELERIWKEAIMTYNEILFCLLSVDTAENYRKHGQCTGIQTRILLHTKEEDNHHTDWVFMGQRN